jgi:hypothetical protein
MEALEFKGFAKRLPDIAATLGTRHQALNTQECTVAGDEAKLGTGATADLADHGKGSHKSASTGIAAEAGKVNDTGQLDSKDGSNQSSGRQRKAKGGQRGSREGQAEGQHTAGVECMSAGDNGREIDLQQRVAEMAGVMETWKTSGQPEQWQALLEGVGDLDLDGHESGREVRAAVFTVWLILLCKGTIQVQYMASPIYICCCSTEGACFVLYVLVWDWTSWCLLTVVSQLCSGRWH